MTILTGDCRHHAGTRPVRSDPRRSAPWRHVARLGPSGRRRWTARARDALSPTGSLWVFGPLRCSSWRRPTASPTLVCASRRKSSGRNRTAPASTPIASSACMNWPSSSIQPRRRGATSTMMCRRRPMRRRAPRGASNVRRIPAGSMPATISAMTAGQGSCARHLRAQLSWSRRSDPTEKPSALLEIRSARVVRARRSGRRLVRRFRRGRESLPLSGRHYLGCEIDAAMAERARARIAAVLPFHGGGAA